MITPIFFNFTLTILSFFVGMFLMPKIINIGSKLIKGKSIGRNLGLKSCEEKSRIPAIGGISFIATFIPLIFWPSVKILLVSFIVVIYGLIGLYDDYVKISKESSDGISAKYRFFSEVIIALLFTILMVALGNLKTAIFFPFIGYVEINRYLFYALSTLTVVGTANGVNLTDGLDGLAIIPMIISSMSLLFAINYLNIEVDKNIAFLLCCFIGAGLSFFWFNSHPAKIFMGDVGSLSGGCLIACISICLGMHIFMIMFGALFVVETASVILQVVYFKKTGGKRIFLMTPIHHHFSKKGMKETHIVCRSWIFATIFSLLGCAILSLNA